MKRDLERLTFDLQQQRADLEKLMNDSTVSHRTTEELARKIEQLRARMEAVQQQPTSEQ